MLGDMLILIAKKAGGCMFSHPPAIIEAALLPSLKGIQIAKLGWKSQAVK
jgi:hypothetical protein